VSTACTNEEQILFKLKIGQHSGALDSKNKRKLASMQKKKGKGGVAKQVGDEGLDEETKNIIDNQLD
jgi:hypothetical protein